MFSKWPNLTEKTLDEPPKTIYERTMQIRKKY